MVYAFPQYNATFARNGTLNYGTPGSAPPPALIEYMLKQVVHPLPTGEEMRDYVAELRLHKLAKVLMECVVFRRAGRKGKFPALGEAGTYCLEPGSDHLLATWDYATMVAMRTKTMASQGADVSVQLAVRADDAPAAKAQIEVLEGRSTSYEEVTALGGLQAQDPILQIEAHMVAATIQSDLKIEIPASPSRRRNEGRLYVRVLVAKDGRVESLDVLTSSEPDWTAAVLASLRRAIYKPALLNGVPVRSETVDEYDYAKL